MKLWDRRATLTVGTTQIQMRGINDVVGALKFQFDVTKTIRPEPNKCVVKIWNLNASHRKSLEQASPVGSNVGIPVQVEAGYAEGTSVVFLGDVRTVVTEKDGPDFVTTIGGGDGEKAFQSARVSQSIAKGSTPQDVLQKLATSLGVKPGNLSQAVGQIRSNFAGIFLGGTVLSGQASSEMTRICKSLDLEWSVQNGALQIVNRTAALATKAIVLSKDTGMIGTPTLSIDSKDKKQILTCRSLLQPDVYPGRIVVLQGENIQGQFRIEETHHQGDTRGEQWEVECKSKRY